MNNINNEMIIKELVNSYNEGKRKMINNILILRKSTIKKMLDAGLSIVATKIALEKHLGIKIKNDTFYKFVQKNITKKSSKKTANNTKKTYTETVTPIKNKEETYDDIKKRMQIFYPESAEYQ